MNTRTVGSSNRLIRRFLIFVGVAFAVGSSWAQVAPVETLVQDTLYRADGKVAHGTLTIRWNGFTSSGGEAVAAGEMTVKTNANGGIAIPLIANTGSSPSGTYYRVYMKLDDGTTSEELWVVPAVATTTIAAIRAKVAPQAVAAQFVSRDYVDTALAAVDATLATVAPGTLVHLTGAETIVGAKTFAVSPGGAGSSRCRSGRGQGIRGPGICRTGNGGFDGKLQRPVEQTSVSQPGCSGSDWFDHAGNGECDRVFGERNAAGKRESERRGITGEDGPVEYIFAAADGDIYRLGYVGGGADGGCVKLHYYDEPCFQGCAPAERGPTRDAGDQWKR